MASISIRERMLKDGKARLILNFYLPGGKRKTEKLDLTIVKKPTTREEREANKTVKQLADRIRAKRLLEIQNKRYGFTDTQKLQSSFPDYFKKEVEKRRRTGSYGNWQSTYQVLLKFLDNKDLAFEDVDTTFLEKFKKYLLEARITKSNEKLARNSALSYFNKVKAALNQAFDDKIIQDRVGQRVKSIKEQDTHREYLTVEELKKLINTDCESELLKRAFLFSAATGLRWSDVNALTWANVEYSDELKCHQLRFVQQKTKGSEILPISDQALDFIGERSKDDERLHSQLEFLVCQVWCNANDNDTCESLLQPDFEIIYNSYGWLKAEVDAVYEACKVLIPEQRADIRSAFSINNRIEELCENVFRPIDLDDLPNVVTSLMKPLLEKFYTRLLGLAGVVGNKLDYYNSLINRNDFKTCPCCGLSIIESAESHYREDNDHYLPKAEFPFAVVNFKNLVPLYGKCNKNVKAPKTLLSLGECLFIHLVMFTMK